VDVRPLIAKDAAALDVWFIAQGRRDLAGAAFLADDRVLAVGAFVHGDLVGAAWGHVLARPDGGPMGLLYDLEVEDLHRRKGLGAALVAEFRRLAEQAGCATFWLITEDANPSAQALYESCGGTPERQRTIFHWDLTDTER
jgi:GNAT superfamily N-acetyltransferase